MTGADRLVGFVSEVLAANDDTLRVAADAVVRASTGDRIVLTAGAGHSLAAVMESFYRAGGLACVRPLWDERVHPLAGAARSTASERVAGLGRRVAEDASIEAGDVVVVFSNSGVNAYPVEIAQVARAAGATVIAVTSLAASAEAPLRAGVRLHEIADIVLDTRVVTGDASWPVDDPTTAPLSSIATTVLWARLLQVAVDIDPDLPLWRSANVAGNDTFNRELAARFASRIPEL